MGKILINPILPVWLMGIICVGLLFLKRKSLGAYIRQIIAVLLLFIINIRPMVPNESISVETEKLNIKVITKLYLHALRRKHRTHFFFTGNRNS